MNKGYQVNLEEVCKNQSFTPSQVVSSELVLPSGAVPNSMLLWVRIELTNGSRRFVTLALRDFYKYVTLPESSIGGWTDGDRGSNSSGLDPRYALDHSGDSEEASSELQLGTESVEEVVET